MSLSRRGKAAIAVLLIIALGALTLPYLDALGFIIRAADIPGAPATVAGWRASVFTPEAVFTVPTRAGDVPARFYRPAGAVRRTVLLLPARRRWFGVAASQNPAHSVWPASVRPGIRLPPKASDRSISRISSTQ